MSLSTTNEMMMQNIFWTISSLIIVFSSILAQECTSPNGFSARCIPLIDCKSAYDFMRISQNRLFTLEERQFFGRMQCEHSFDEVPQFCCATNDPNFNSLFVENGTVLSTEQRFMDATNLPNPANYECGVDFLANRIFGGSNTELNEFPWMALLEYIKPTGAKDFACGGSLINRRYVLTAAHCITGEILRKKGRLVSVRLGEYNLETPVDCEVTEDGSEVCAPPVLNMAVESTKAHPGYTITWNPSYNDLGLVRLADDVPEVSNIYPICMPPVSFESNFGSKYVVVGWGKTSTSKKSAIKQKLIVPLYNFEDCQNLFTQIEIVDTQLCAGGEAGKDSCNGDSGGPLMTVHNGVWIMEGIVSFGVNSCGKGGIPGIYTRVTKYIDWIRSNLEP